MSTLAASLVTKRAAIAALGLLIAAAAVVAVLNDRGMFNRGMFGRGAGGGNIAGAVRNGVETGVNGIKAVADSVASLFDSRSPGEREAGLLANLKHKRQAALHQRALPKVRGPANPLAGIVGAVPMPPPIEAPVIAQPVDKIVSGAPGPLAISPPGGVVGGPGGGGFPGVLIPGGGGGGGGVIVPPPAVNPPVTPPVVVPPTTSGVPEPSSWAMMLLGFLLIGGAARRVRRISASI